MAAKSLPRSASIGGPRAPFRDTRSYVRRADRRGRQAGRSPADVQRRPSTAPRSRPPVRFGLPLMLLPAVVVVVQHLFSRLVEAIGDPLIALILLLLVPLHGLPLALPRQSNRASFSAPR